MNNDYLLNVSEAAERLRTDKNTVYKLIKTGKLSALKIKSYKIRNYEINRFLEDNDGKDLDDYIK